MVKIVISGRVGSGKTTAVKSVSLIRPAQTEVRLSDGGARVDKKTTTVGMDYGEVVVGANTRVGLYGTPGQRRFDFVCRTLSRGAAGLLILVDHLGREPLEDLRYYAKLFKPLIPGHRTMLAVTRVDGAADFSLGPYREVLDEMGLEIDPVILDAREPLQVRGVIERLILKTVPRTADLEKRT
jgi:uncharacterized protein